MTDELQLKHNIEILELIQKLNERVDDVMKFAEIVNQKVDILMDVMGMNPSAGLHIKTGLKALHEEALGKNDERDL